jgi:hypothetical protein
MHQKEEGVVMLFLMSVLFSKFIQSIKEDQSQKSHHVDVIFQKAREHRGINFMLNFAQMGENFQKDVADSGSPSPRDPIMAGNFLEEGNFAPKGV